jgi:hypothetical protein
MTPTGITFAAHPVDLLADHTFFGALASGSTHEAVSFVCHHHRPRVFPPHSMPFFLCEPYWSVPIFFSNIYMRSIASIYFK